LSNPPEPSFIEGGVVAERPLASGSLHRSTTRSHTTTTHCREQLENSGKETPKGITPNAIGADRKINLI